MAKVELKAKTVEPKPEVVEQSLAVVPREDLSVTKPVIQNLPMGVSGEWTEDLIVHPRINLVAKTGDLSNVFAPGSYVLDKEHLFADGKKPFRVIFGKLELFYLENVEWGTEAVPRSVDTVAQVRALGGTASYEEHEADKALPYFRRAAKGICILESDVEHPRFPKQIGDKWYTAATWLLAKSSFTHAAKKVFNDSRYSPNGTAGRSYLVTSKIETGPSGSYYVPKLVDGPKTEPEILSALAGSL